MVSCIDLGGIVCDVGSECVLRPNGEREQTLQYRRNCSLALSFSRHKAWRVKFLRVKYNFEIQGNNDFNNLGNIWQISWGESDCYIN